MYKLETEVVINSALGLCVTLAFSMTQEFISSDGCYKSIKWIKNIKLEI